MGESTDLDVCFTKARDAKMIEDDDERFIRQCIECESSMGSVDACELELTEDLVHRLHMCAIKLNTADSA